ncbi:MAG: hypothetical protein V3R87_04490 [Dehalococcoidia bacterium]
MARTPKKTTPTGRPSRRGTQPSSTGKKNPEADQTNWRKKLQQSRLKFDDEQKYIYLEHLAAHGLKGRAAGVSGVCSYTVNKHIKNDPDFEEAVNEAIETYNDTVGDEVRRRGVEGFLKPIFYKGARVIEPILDEDGVQLTTEDGQPRYRYCDVMEHSDRMLELEAKRTNPAYRDKQTIDLNATGGVLVVPEPTTEKTTPLLIVEELPDEG